MASSLLRFLHPGFAALAVHVLLLILCPLFAVATLALAAPAPDTLVICPADFQAALEPWVALRTRQGYKISTIEPPATAARLRAEVRRVARSGRLKFLVLVGDVPESPTASISTRRRTIPTNYLPAKINTRWGSESTIATDIPYADVDNDGVPELAVGRIPADTAEEVSAVVRKIIRYEQQPQRGSWQKRLELVAGLGGFGWIADAAIESISRQVIQQTIPPDYQIRPTLANPKSRHCPPPGQFAKRVRAQFSEGCLAWIYLGHGLSTELDRVVTPTGNEPIMSVADVALLRCGAQSPLAVLIACYTGAVDAKSDCLAERLVLEEDGPVAVIAATRVTMPYGNTVLGYELLRACFQDRPAAIGTTMRLAQRRALAPGEKGDALRSMFDSFAKALGPPPVDLVAERREHVAMYQLLGDPLTKLRLPAERVAATRTAVTVVK